MNQEPTTAAIQRCLDALQGDATAEPPIRDLLERAVRRLRLLCASLLQRSYPRLTQPPLNLETDELLDGVVAGLLTALKKVRPESVRQFFALANQHIRWQLNDIARRLDEQPRGSPLAESRVAAPPSSADSCLSPDGRRIWQAIDGLPRFVALFKPFLDKGFWNVVCRLLPVVQCSGRRTELVLQSRPYSPQLGPFAHQAHFCLDSFATRQGSSFQ